ncbi:Mth938-like domain-containing protein [Azospira restricta]|uniref:Mth938-like domain-containing protein n=1 Tax=Azospira restricta TaxID=404405 RepID=A0A974PVB6_9RHOO|nr:Mth938-like domain-containing protein [Azospira restricta]QRJ62187.1 Mth938-like domain-containing protein [Azospira restricta]
MKLHLSDADSKLNTFTGYGDGYVAVNGIQYRSNITVLPGQLLPEWTAASFETLVEADFAKLAALQPEILLLGTGSTLRFPAPALLQPLLAARIGLEVMDTQAACRTYNILVAEGRRVAAAILV